MAVCMALIFSNSPDDCRALILVVVVVAKVVERLVVLEAENNVCGGGVGRAI